MVNTPRSDPRYKNGLVSSHSSAFRYNMKSTGKMHTHSSRFNVSLAKRNVPILNQFQPKFTYNAQNSSSSKQIIQNVPVSKFYL